MNFSEALIELKKGCSLKRTGWNGKNLYVLAFKSIFCGEMFLITNTATNIINSWVPSVSDLYAEDWELYKGE